MTAPAAPAGWEHFPVAADVGVHAWAQDVPGCFRQCALGVFDLIVPVAAVARREVREASARGEGLEGLLVEWLNELLYLHDVEGFVICDLEAPLIEGSRVHARLYGEVVDPMRHPLGTLVKAATYHEASLVVRPGRVDARVILDI